jgi:response regulator RpfG family c-di-GMP phosphodiesterase
MSATLWGECTNLPHSNTSAVLQGEEGVGYLAQAHPPISGAMRMSLTPRDCPRYRAQPLAIFIDDDNNWLDRYAAALGGHLDVITTTRGEIAYALARSKQPDIVVLTLGNGSSEGRALYRTLGSEQETSALPVLALAVRDETAADHLAAAPSTAARLLLPPHTPSRVLRACCELLGRGEQLVL